MIRAIVRILPAVLLYALPAVAQQSRYTVPGGLGERRVDVHDAILKARAETRWRLGFLDLEPRLAITDLGYVSNVFSTGVDESTSDLRATALAGLRGFFNLGPKVLVSPFADLSHNWWQEQTDLRSTNESYGVQVFGDFNRLQLSVQVGQTETQRNLSSEVEVPIDLRADRVDLGFDIDFWGPFRLFAGAATAEQRFSGTAAERNVPGLGLTTLDVDTERVNAGLGYELSSGLEIGLGVERAEATYLVDPEGRSSRGTGPLVRVLFRGSRLYLDLRAAWRDLEFASGQSAERRELTGLAQLEWKLTEKLSAGVYGGNQLQASALDSAVIYESRRTGAFLRRQQGDRGVIRVFYEAGFDDFATVVVDEIIRSDDFETYGLNLDYDLTPRLTIQLGFFDSRRDSSNPQFDREFTGLQTAVRLGGNLLPW